MHVVARLCGSLLIAVVAACRGDSTPEVVQDPRAIGTTTVASSPPDSSVLLAAQRALTAYLDASRESTLDPAALDTLSACGDGGQPYFPTTILAGYSLLPSEFRGDTIVGRAEVVTVAEQDVDRRAMNRFVARQRLRSDILEWDVYADDSGRWVVCNGLRFGYRGVDSLTTWRPDGASYESARHLADSIAEAQAMIVAVFGASGRTGRLFVQMAGEAGLLQRLHFRTASDAPSPDTATVVVGALNDPTAVREVLRGADAALILFGPHATPGKAFCATATKAIIAGMRGQGVPRILCVTGATVGEQTGSVSLAMKLFSFGARRTGQDQVMADRDAQERHVRNSKLKWTLVKPPRLTDEPAGELDAGPSVPVGLGSHCSRQALSRFLVKELMQPQYLDSAVYVKDR